MNSYAITTQFLIDQFESNSLVNTIIFGAVDTTDLNKSNIFPLVHIWPSNWRLSGNRIEFTYDIAVVSARHIPKKTQTSKIFGDNLIDNLNQATAILSKELTSLELKRNEYDIILESSTDSKPIIFWEKNLLDGWESTIVLSIQNTISICND